ncbi:hypothetical protein GCM10023194_67970 [Planotetraspora phitsanulokensis]|uniref:Uncharacterized protein n=1 Tax=Planotetraspora phitsanulokensis TaxID=575192 RepID=A0A8J3U7F5_9ACTN|nr:hypothetical protein Pph01_46430 [Planotetraspora phitsanulokensis]
MDTTRTFSAAGRRTFGRVPAGLRVAGGLLTLLQIFVGAALILGPAIADDTPGQRAGSIADDKGTDGDVEITYLITGDRRTADVSYQTPHGQESKDGAALPFRVTFRFHREDYTSVQVENLWRNGAGKVMCTVLANGVVVQQSSEFGDNATASCGGSTGEYKPLPGATVPPTTAPSGILPGEVRLTKVVAVKRYGGTGSPVVRRVTDPDAHLSYAELGGAWNDSRRTDPQLDGFSRQQSFDTEPKWQALIASGAVDGDLMDQATGRDRLRVLTSAVQDSRQIYNFDESVRGRDIASQPIKVSGRPGWVIVREMHFDKPGVQAKMDLSAVIVVDTGRVRPSYLWVDLPESHKKLWPDINTMISSLRVA